MNNSTKNEIEFLTVFSTVLDNLPDRSQEIVAKRFGVGEEKPMTLQAIGDEYGITRERVRQIVQSGLKSVRNASENDEIEDVKVVIVEHIESNNGIISVEDIVVISDESDDEGVIRFLLEGMTEVDYVNPKKHPVQSDVVALSDFDIEEWTETHDEMKDVFEQKQKTYTSKRLEEKNVNKKDFDSEKIETYLKVSSKIGKNPFDKWGLYEWDEISPRGVREKALLIMKEKDEPMHFRDIAQSIDDYGLGKNGKKSHPQTVHNELIRDDNFVLVGRGVYALNDGNYEQGTVKDVITNILENSEESLTLDDIVERVLKMRHVKPSTIKVNLGTVAKKMNNKYVLDTNAS